MFTPRTVLAVMFGSVGLIGVLMIVPAVITKSLNNLGPIAGSDGAVTDAELAAAVLSIAPFAIPVIVVLVLALVARAFLRRRSAESLPSSPPRRAIGASGTAEPDGYVPDSTDSIDQYEGYPK